MFSAILIGENIFLFQKQKVHSILSGLHVKFVKIGIWKVKLVIMQYLKHLTSDKRFQHFKLFKTKNKVDISVEHLKWSGIDVKSFCIGVSQQKLLTCEVYLKFCPFLY